MPQRFFRLTCVLLTLFTASGLVFDRTFGDAYAQAPEAPKPIAVVALSGYDALMGDIDFLGGLGGMPGASQLIEMGLMQATQNQGLVGLEKGKPMGVIVQSDSSGMFSGAACVPVNDLDKLLDALGPFGVTSQDMGNGTKQISANGQNVFGRTAGGWAFLSIMPQMLENLPADPSGPLGTLSKEYDLAVRLHVQNIPEAYRQMAIDAMTSGAQQSLEQEGDESDADYATRQEQLQLQLEELERVVQEMDELTFGLSIDSQQQRTFLDISYTALAGTKLAQDMALNARPTTNFAGFFQPDAAMRLSFASKTSPADIAQLDQMLKTVRTQARKAIDQESKLPDEESKSQMKDALDDLLEAVKATLQAGVMDGGAVLNMTPEALTFVAGGFIGDPSKVEDGLKKVVEVAKQDNEFPGVNWGAANHRDVTFHTLSAPIKGSEEEARRLFGDAVDMAIGIGKNSVYFALGRDCMAAAKQVIDRSQAEQGKAIPPAEMTFALGQIMDVAKSFAKDDQKPQLALIADMLQNEASGRDHVRIVVQPIPNGQRTRIEAEEGVLRAIGMAIMQAQMAGAGFQVTPSMPIAAFAPVVTHVADVSVVELARRYGTPLFVYDAQLIAERVADLAAFDVVRYAQKANSNLAVLDVVRRAGALVDAVSAGEIGRALETGFLPGRRDAPQIVYTADVFDRESLNLVVEHDIPVNCGSPDMIDQYGAVAPGRGITLRINPGFGHGHSQKTNTGGAHSKHGIWHEQLTDCLRRAARYHLTVEALHMHIGSGTDMEHLSQVCSAMEAAVALVGPSVTAISAGGGLPTPYRDGDQSVDLAAYFQLWDASRQRFALALGHPLRLEIEPGRFLVAESGSLIAEIRAIKNMGDNLFYLVDAGFNNLARPILYGAYHPLAVCPTGDQSEQGDGLSDASLQDAPLQDVIVGGPLCESGDIFTQEEGGYVAARPLPRAQVGDLLVIGCAGAYGAVMGSNYNSKPLAAETLIDQGRVHLVRERQTFADLIRGERIVRRPEL